MYTSYFTLYYIIYLRVHEFGSLSLQLHFQWHVRDQRLYKIYIYIYYIVHIYRCITYRYVYYICVHDNITPVYEYAAKVCLQYIYLHVYTKYIFYHTHIQY